MTSIYPCDQLSKFVNHNDDITSEDLVTWIIVGVRYLPHTEDIPVTGTPANHAGRTIVQSHYFDKDPLVASHDGVMVKPGLKGS